MSEKVYGIDLGTTYSCLAGFDENGKVTVFDNDQLESTTPSVVWFAGQRAVVGSPAKEQEPVNPREVVSAIKRKMGTSETVVQSGKTLRPEMVSALILKKLAQDGKIYGGGEKPKVVITCPAYFGVEERAATKLAGVMAGLDVLSVVNEPSAAAFSYGVEQESLDGKTVMVFDLGGGTFDVTVMRMGEKIEVIATGGDRYLGGRDWDKAIALYFIERFCEATGTDRVRATKDEGFLAEMQSLAEKRKRQLTNSTKTKVSIEHGGERCTFEFTREEFDAKTAGLLESALAATRRTLEEAEKKDPRFNPYGMDILMVGGSTLMPQVSAALEKEFGKAPKVYRPHEAVARGAALYARQTLAVKKHEARGGRAEDLFLGGERGGGDYTLGGDLGPEILNVTSKSYGVMYAKAPDDPREEVPPMYVSNLIAKNTPLPFEPHTEFLGGFERTVGEGLGRTVDDNQQEVKFELFEDEEMELWGAQDPEICTKIGEMTITGLPPGRPRGQLVRTYMTLDREGLLHAWGIDDETGRRCDVEIKTSHVMSANEAKTSGKAVVDWFTVE